MGPRNAAASVHQRADDDRLRKRIIAAFREKKFDDGLTGGVEVVEAALKANVK